MLGGAAEAWSGWDTADSAASLSDVAAGYPGVQMLNARMASQVEVRKQYAYSQTVLCPQASSFPQLPPGCCHCPCRLHASMMHISSKQTSWGSTDHPSAHLHMAW
jgi:hypothetical protein